MAIPPVLRALLSTPGPSGAEGPAAAVWREHAGAFAEVGSDVMGSSWARVPGTGGGPSVALVGHIDEIGLIVTHVDDDGFAWFTGIGGWDPQVLVGQRVAVRGREGTVPGVIGRKPIHLLKGDEREKVMQLKDMHIDLGAKDGDEARALVRVGDVAVIAGDPLELPNERAASRSMDNRLGSFVAYEAARLVAEAGGAPGDVIACAVAQEETVFGGSRTVGWSVKPDVAIAIDVTHATDAPGVSVQENGKHPLGSGPVIEFGSLLHPAISERLVEAADAEGIAWTAAANGRSTGTDADALHVTGAGIATGLVSLPLRYMHSPVEVVQVSDVLDAARLLAAFCRRLEPGTTFVR